MTLSSIPFTFREALLLIRRNLWFLFVVALVTGIPKIFCTLLIASSAPVSSSHPHSPALGFAGLVGLLGMFVFDAAYIAGTLGLLTTPSSSTPPIPLLWESIRAHTWTILKVNFLLVVVVILAAIPFGMLLEFVRPAKMVWMILLTLTLVLMKYSLAYPLVVVDKIGARQALQRSWNMTRGHFWYVFGCYFLLFLYSWSINQVVGANAHDITQQPVGIYFLKNFTVHLADLLWTVLAWCMYTHLKAIGDTQLSPPVREDSTVGPI